MIQQLGNHQEEIAKAILDVQIPAYQIEAELIGFDGIPPLKESVEDIRKSDETFFGYFDGHLIGFISYKQKNKLIDIHRLVVHPDFFRQGIAKKLIGFLVLKFPGHQFIVSTGQENVPAKKLYAFFGFVEQNSFEVAPGIWCTKLLLNN
ncbi:GNAT family N-acetyltransferase [Planomicrobium sp. CPCC 101110]|uniref:GNAT family N-acetyltransferase n=1 Tax=Planomicrobium sp. CPCC 101110 TaxID=2599619 RepID=UPI0011B451C5|nr:GNAT family N-acetyltransferase [Planomicrobium sp. CPCC 101110]TWT27498.1 GNAT family N-acetyltransferase [Planomicrobium sp. CPCC 101110]